MTTKKRLDIYVLTPDYLDHLRNWRAFLAVGAEVVLSLVPIIVLVLVVVVMRPTQHATLFAEPEWSFISAVLFAQAIVRFVAGASSLPTGSRWESVIFAVALLFTFGVVPSLAILIFVLLTHEPPTWLQWLQIVFFLLAIACFWIMGTVGHAMLSVEEGQEGQGEILPVVKTIEGGGA